MNIIEAIETLENHNKWRRDDSGQALFIDPKQIGIAIELVLIHLKSFIKEDPSTEKVRIRLQSEFVNVARRHIGSKVGDVPELSEISDALKVIKKYCD